MDHKIKMEAERLAWQALVTPAMNAGRLVTKRQMFLKRKRMVGKEITEAMEIIETGEATSPGHVDCVARWATKQRNACMMIRMPIRDHKDGRRKVRLNPG